MTRTDTHREAGMTMIELIVGILVATLIMSGLISLFLNQTRLFGEWQSERNAREAVRGASQVLIADLRRVETSGGIESATGSAVTLRIPFAMGIVCSSTAATTVVSLLPADSLTYATAIASGYAVRASSGYAYQTTLSGVSAGSAATCTSASITTLTGGQVIDVTPGAGTTVAVGTPFMLYQRVTYEFETTSAGTVLTRTVLGGSSTEEVVVERFVPAGTRFRFFVWTSNTAQDAAPADLTTIRGFELYLEGQGDYARPGSPVASSDLAQKVFLMNPPS
jgi:type II secretory pathway pseudopilin PulG